MMIYSFIQRSYTDILSYFTIGDERSIAAKRNIAISFILKGLGIIISLQMVPLTMYYVNSSKYGIWLTLSSIVNWLAYFDFGFAHGFRNRFAEAKAKGDMLLARKYLSTIYVVLGILFSLIFIAVINVNIFLNWSELLNVGFELNDELHFVFALLAFFFCLNMVANVCTTMLTADQKTGLVSFILFLGQLFSFVMVYVMTKTVEGSLVNLAFAISGVPCLILIVFSFVLFRMKNYKEFSPSFRCVDFSLTKDLLGLGGQFFVIMLSMLFVYQFINIIISRIEGPEVVTQYNIAFRYFSVLSMVAIIVLTPFWSAFTDAYAKKDFEWMKKVQKKLELMWLMCIPVVLIMLLLSNYIYSLWIGDRVLIPFSMSLSVAVYVLFSVLGNVYMYLVNGIGKIRIQLFIYLLFAIISVPMLNLGCKYYGVEGVLLLPTVVCVIQAFFCRKQIKYLVSEKAKGIWNK